MDNYLPIILTGVLTGGFLGFLQFLITRRDAKQDKEKEYATKGDIAPIKAALLAMMQDRLERVMTKYLKEGAISTNQFKTLETMLSAYEELGGDGFIHELYEQCKSLIS